MVRDASEAGSHVGASDFEDTLAHDLHAIEAEGNAAEEAEEKEDCVHNCSNNKYQISNISAKIGKKVEKNEDV